MYRVFSILAPDKIINIPAELLSGAIISGILYCSTSSSFNYDGINIHTEYTHIIYVPYSTFMLRHSV